MTPPAPPDPRDRPGDDDLRRLLSAAVDDLEPRDGLPEIHRRTKVTPMSNRRPWTYAVAGAVAATAAVILAVALAGGTLTGGDDDTAPAAGSSESSEPTTDASPSEEPDASPSEPAGPSADEPTTSAVVPAYYVGDGPRGPVLFREFHRVEVPEDGEVLGAAQEAVSGTPRDPDYRTAWPSGVRVAAVDTSGEVARVDLAGAPRERPSGLSDREADLAVEQLVRTVQGALQAPAPVQLTVDGQPVDQVLGVPTAEPLAPGPALETLSLMSITTPEEGQTVPGTFRATGLSNGFEATVVWQVLDGDRVVAEGFGTAEGWMEERLFPWSVEVDLSDVPPGEYRFVARTDDPSGGAEGGGPDVDDRTIVVE